MMTETTDIAALRRRSNNLRTADQTDAFIDLLLDKLETERQRAETLSKSEWKMAGELGEQIQRAEKAGAKKPVVVLPDINSDKYWSNGKFLRVKYYCDVERSAVAAGCNVKNSEDVE